MMGCSTAGCGRVSSQVLFNGQLHFFQTQRNLSVFFIFFQFQQFVVFETRLLKIWEKHQWVSC
jgi:hypothetical protein